MPVLSSIVGALLAANPLPVATPGAVTPPGAPTSGVPTPGSIDHTPLDPSIYGGDPVEPGAWPAVVAVKTDKLCTGTLVAPNLVLTAAHCFNPTPVNPVEIVVGDSIGGGQTYPAEAWGSHPDFCLPSECGEDIHDFAWVRLASDLQIEPIVPITIQTEYDQSMRVGTTVTFVGYGETEMGTLGEKREVVSSLTSFNDSGREFRAGGDGKDTCLGDSGGPALIEVTPGTWRLAGVISRGGECGGGGIYGVPLPELCWVRDDSGVNLLPAGCEACDCVALETAEPEQGCNCGVARVEPRDLAGLALALLGLGAWWRRRVRAYSPRQGSETVKVVPRPGALK